MTPFSAERSPNAAISPAQGPALSAHQRLWKRAPQICRSPGTRARPAAYFSAGVSRSGWSRFGGGEKLLWRPRPIRRPHLGRTLCLGRAKLLSKLAGQPQEDINIVSHRTRPTHRAFLTRASPARSCCFPSWPKTRNNKSALGRGDADQLARAMSKVRLRYARVSATSCGRSNASRRILLLPGSRIRPAIGVRGHPIGRKRAMKPRPSGPEAPAPIFASCGFETRGTLTRCRNLQSTT